MGWVRCCEGFGRPLSFTRVPFVKTLGSRKSTFNLQPVVRLRADRSVAHGGTERKTNESPCPPPVPPHCRRNPLAARPVGLPLPRGDLFGEVADRHVAIEARQFEHLLLEPDVKGVLGFG